MGYVWADFFFYKVAIIYNLLKVIKDDDDLEEAMQKNHNLTYKFTARGM